MAHSLTTALLLCIIHAQSGRANPLAAPSTDDVTTISVSARIATIPGFPNIFAADRARARVLQKVKLGRGTQASNSRRAASLIPIQNGVVQYNVNVGIGTPPNQYRLLIDTGSSNTWVNSSKTHQFVKTSSTKCTSTKVGVVYGIGAFNGTQCTDTIKFSPWLSVKSQSIGVAYSSNGFDGIDGILGLGPVALTAGTVFGSPSTTIPTVTDNLYKQKSLGQNLVAFYFKPRPVEGDGEMAFGGINTAHLTSAVKYLPITKTYPSSEYWGVDLAISYGSTTLLPTTAGVVDTGTTMTLIATDAFKAYQKATGAILDPVSGFLRITPAQYSSLKPLQFKSGSTVITLSPNGQIWPRTLNIIIGGTKDYLYLIIGDMGSLSHSGLDFLLGYSFHEQHYVVYDTANKRVGFGDTKWTNSTVN